MTSLPIPFFKNGTSGVQCMQASMRSVINYFLDKDYTLEELDKMTGRFGNHWTWTPQVVVALHELGLNVRYFAKTDLKPFLEGELFIRRTFGKDSEQILRYTDIKSLIKSIEETLSLELFTQKVLDIEEMINAIKQNTVPLVVIDHNVITGNTGAFQGHMVTLTGFDDTNVYFHDSGPPNAQPNKKVEKTLFAKAASANGTDHDTILVSV